MKKLIFLSLLLLLTGCARSPFECGTALDKDLKELSKNVIPPEALTNQIIISAANNRCVALVQVDYKNFQALYDHDKKDIIFYTHDECPDNSDIRCVDKKIFSELASDILINPEVLTPAPFVGRQF